jgi:nucleoside-diphosphate-sugar epimerase
VSGVLVTGGTGALGSALVPRLGAPRVLSRRPGPGRVVGDLDTGAGLVEALREVSVVVHAAGVGRCCRSGCPARSAPATAPAGS